MIGEFKPELFDMCREVAERHRQHGFGTIEHQCRGLGIRRSVTLATNRTLLEWRFANWDSVKKVFFISVSSTKIFV